MLKKLILNWAGLSFLIIQVILLSSCSNNIYPTKIVEYNLHEPLSFPNQKKIVLVGGCFDVLHYGHINFLKNAKSAGDILVVALEPDETISLYKKRTPIHTQSQRATNLAAIKYVDYVLLLPSLKGFRDYNQLVQDIKPDIIAVTANDPQIKNKQIQADSINASLRIVIDRIDGFSTSKIVSKK
ncbi:MAG: FAD synthase [Rickettsiales bacterium]|nr:FAD synthase [Rickettsiales bacterium]MCA0254039.1 FAD synthase [Pseudomonadota bacterium]